MAMTKEEILKAIRNHEGEIKASMASLDYTIHSLVKGYRKEVPGEIDSLKSMMTFVKGRTDEIKQILGQWPE